MLREAYFYMDVHPRYFANVLFERYLVKEIRNGISSDSHHYSRGVFYATNCEKMEAKIKIPRRGFFAENTHLADREEFP